MEWRKKRLSCRQAKELDMVDYLSQLGHEPSKVKGKDFWYLSPLREERTASFKINRNLNRWFDFGVGKGGNIIDFGIAYHRCTVADFLDLLSGYFSFHQQSVSRDYTSENQRSTNLHILTAQPISHPALLRYLQTRQIPISHANEYCQEVHFEMQGKRYFAIGFGNNLGGYELRNPYFKGSASPKGVSTILNGAKELVIFEGFFDFLSLLVLLSQRRPRQMDFLVLNSLSFFESSLPFMNEYERVRLFLDNDGAGQNCSRSVQALGNRFTDESGRYKDFKDLNDNLVNMGNGVSAFANDFPQPP